MANKRVNDDGSMKAVIYARYSSENQREESIDGQIRECYAFARKNNISVVAEYIDRAFSAKTDRRPDFQRMIKDSAKKNFNLVLVWKIVFTLANTNTERFLFPTVFRQLSRKFYLTEFKKSSPKTKRLPRDIKRKTIIC